MSDQNQMDRQSFPSQLVEILGSTDDDNDGISLKEWNDAVEASFSSPHQDQQKKHQSPPESTEEPTLSIAGSMLAEALSQEERESEQEELLRATKNALRWNLQYLPPNRCFSLTLQSKELLTTYHAYLTKSIAWNTNSHQNDDQVARYATLSLFYATFAATERADLLKHVVSELKYLDAFGLVLVTCRNMSVVLASLRLLHNLLVSYQSTTKIFTYHDPVAIPSQGEDKGVDDLVPWLATTAGTSTTALSIHDLLITLLHHCLVKPLNPADRLVEVRTELLRILYVLRAGKTMSTTLLIKLLQFRDDNDVRLAAVTLLMDVPTPLALTESVVTLFALLEFQVTFVLEQTLVGPAAASTVTPILIVLRNYCMSSSSSSSNHDDHDDWTSATRHFIFPNSLLPESSNDSAKNKMSPKDAPRGTLRWKCIQLLTWTQGHVKRCMAELLWTLCFDDPQEYTQRVGLGNAMPLLQSKGFMDEQGSNSMATMNLNDIAR